MYHILKLKESAVKYKFGNDEKSNPMIISYNGGGSGGGGGGGGNGGGSNGGATGINSTQN